MKTAKLIIGIIAIVLSLVLFFQAFLVGLGDALFSEEGEGSGGIGIFMSVLLLIGGIVSVSTRKSRGGALFCLIDFAIAGIMGLACAGSFSDLSIWGTISLIFGSIHLISLFTGKKTNEEN
ncbi:MAG: hypothetical protein ACI4NM_04490 [Bullifex sp.]